MNPFDLEKMLVQMNKEVFCLLSLSNDLNTNVLDAGCGVGEGLVQMAAEYKNAHFTGVNISSAQIDFGKKRIHELGMIKRIDLIACDFQNTPFNDKIFDKIFAVESACYGKGKDKSIFLKEMNRLLKTRGKLVVVDGFKRHSEPLNPWLEKLHRQNLKYWAIEQMADIQLFEKALLENGFVNIQMEDISWNVLPSAFHLPITALKLEVKRFFSKNNVLTKAQKSYTKAIWLTLFLGLFRKHFGYFIVTAEMG